MPESVDPDRLLTSDISAPRKTSAKKLLELARQRPTPTDASEPSPIEQELSNKSIPLKGIPEEGMPPKGTPKSSSQEGNLPEEPITLLTNYTKLDNDVCDKLARFQTLAEQIVYLRLYRLSWGYRRRTVRIGLGSLAKAVGISRSAAQRNLESLIAKGHINAYDDWSQEGRLYRVLLPCELDMESKTVVGSPVEQETEEKGIPPEGIPSKGYTSKRYTGIPPEGIPLKGTNKEKVLIKKERNSLSPLDLVIEFYKRIGQDRPAKKKRERGDHICQELVQEGYSIKDIEFACDWAVENIPKIHSFDLIPEIMGQAMAEREKVQTEAQRAEQRRRTEEEKRKQEEIRQQIRKQAEEQLVHMDPEDENALRKQALDRMPEETKKLIDSESAAFKQMVRAHQLDIIEEHQCAQVPP